MEETQAIEFDDLPSEEEPLHLDIHQVAGELQTVSETADKLPLYLGLNVVGRGSSQADQEVMLNKWKADFSGMPVHDLESAGAVCWIKDTGSRNKTMLGRAGGLTVLQSKGDRYSVLPGDKLKFGTVDTIITYSTTYHQANTAGGVQPGSDHGDSSHATEGRQHVSRSPTPDMAAAQVPSAPAAATDNDMTLPWGDPLVDQPDLQHKSSPGNAAVETETEVHEPSHTAEQPSTEAPILPDTQANDLPGDMDAGFRELSTGPQDLAFAEPTQLADAPTHLMGEPTQLVGEPTQLAIPARPVAAASSAQPGSHAGTALASAAAQAMTGAHPSQASVLPSSGGFPTAMPSLANPPPAPAPSPAGSALAQNSGPGQGMSKSLPISGPEADAVLHLPSQPSGSQHAAHPHGPPRTQGAGSAADAARKPGRDTQKQQAGTGEQSHHEQTQQGLGASQGGQGDSAAAGAGSSDHNTLLDSVLGHDDDDSIWMPPASLPDSEGGPHEGGQDMPLQLPAPTAGAAEGSAPAAVPVPPAAQQASDSNQTQDSQQDAGDDGTSAPPAAARGPTHQGNAGRALPHAEDGMYTGAFAFPDSASLEVFQPAVDLPHNTGKGRPGTAARPAARGKAAKAAAAAAASKAGKEAAALQGKATAAEAGKKSAPAVRDDRADVAKDASSGGAGAGGGASAGGSPKGRVMPSGWKKKKADPEADGHADSVAEEATEAAGPSAEPPAGALPDQGSRDAAQKTEAAPSTTHVAHGAGKPTPWRARGTPLGVGPAGGPSQLPNSEDINAAMAAAGDLAACFPSTQAEQEVAASVAAHTTVEPPSSIGITAAAAPPSKSVAAAAVAEESNPAAASTDEDGVRGVSDHASVPQQPSASTAAEHGHDRKATSQSGHTSAEAEHQQSVAAEADSRSADQASHAQPDEAEDVQTHRGAGQRQAPRRKQAGRANEEEEEDHGSADGRGRGRGSRGKGRGQARGRKRRSPDAGTEEDATRAAKPEAKAAKGKRGRSKGREASPALQPTRVSKRQKAKAEAQAQQEEEEDHNPEDDTFFGAATQAAAGILEDLRRRATPDEDADVDEAAEAAPPVPALQPSMKGRRSTAKRTALAASAAASEPAVKAAEAPAQGPAVPDSQSSGKSSRSKRRASVQSKATVASGGGNDPLLGQEDSAGGSGAAASTAAQSTGHDSTAAGGSSEGHEEGSMQVKRGQKRQAGADSTGQGRRKSRLSRASSPAPDPSPVADAPRETLAKQPGPARRGATAKQPHAEKQKRSEDTDTSAPKRKSGTGSTAVKTQGAATNETAPEKAEEGAGSGSMEEAVADRVAGTSKASSSRGKAKRKSALTRVDDEYPPAASGGGRRGSSGGQPASQQAAAASTAHVAPPADESAAGNAVPSKAKQGPRAKQIAARRQSQTTSAPAIEAREEAQPSAASSGRRRGPQAKASTARAASQSQDAAGEGDGEEEEMGEDEDKAGPSVQQPGGDGAAAEKGTQAKGKAVRGKRSRQSLEEDAAADVGPAGHVKAARKATDSKPVRVLYSTALDKAKKSSMTKVIRRLGGSVEDAEGPDFTHFVALQPTAANQTDRGFKKSINALIALAAGRPIVSESWVEACNRSSSFVDPLDHLLIDKAAQKKYGFDLRTSYERAQHQLLLAGLHIFFTPGALAGESDGGTNIKNLVEHAGGVVEQQLPKSASSKDSGMWSQWLLIGSENDKNKDQKMCRKQYAAGLTFHGRSMLIDSIMQQSLDRKHGVLFTT